MILQIRPATLNDVETLLRWRNDPITRASFKSPEIVPWDEHFAWLAQRLDYDRPDLFIAEMNSEPVATYRIDDGQISYTVAPERRRQGIATQLLACVRQRHGSLTAEVRPQNIGSIKAAERAGHAVVII